MLEKLAYEVDMGCFSIHKSNACWMQIFWVYKKFRHRIYPGLPGSIGGAEDTGGGARNRHAFVAKII